MIATKYLVLYVKRKKKKKLREKINHINASIEEERQESAEGHNPHRSVRTHALTEKQTEKKTLPFDQGYTQYTFPLAPLCFPSWMFFFIPSFASKAHSLSSTFAVEKRFPDE